MAGMNEIPEPVEPTPEEMEAILRIFVNAGDGVPDGSPEATELVLAVRRLRTWSNEAQHAILNRLEASRGPPSPHS